MESVDVDLVIELIPGRRAGWSIGYVRESYDGLFTSYVMERPELAFIGRPLAFVSIVPGVVGDRYFIVYLFEPTSAFLQLLPQESTLYLLDNYISADNIEGLALIDLGKNELINISLPVVVEEAPKWLREILPMLGAGIGYFNESVAVLYTRSVDLGAYASRVFEITPLKAFILVNLYPYSVDTGEIYWDHDIQWLLDYVENYYVGNGFSVNINFIKELNLDALNRSFEYNILSQISIIFIFYILFYIFVFNYLYNIVRPEILRLARLFYSMGFSGSRLFFAKALKLAAITFLLVAFTMIVNGWIGSLLPGRVSEVFSLASTLVLLLSLAYILVSVLGVNYGGSLFRGGNRGLLHLVLAASILLLAQYLISFFFSQYPSIVVFSLSLPVLLFLSYLVFRARLLLFRAVRVVIDPVPLVALAALVVGLIVIPSMYYSGLVKVENDMVEEVFAGYIDNITLIRGAGPEYLGNDSMEAPLYVVTSYLAAKVDGLTLINITAYQAPSGGPGSSVPESPEVVEYTIDIEAEVRVVIASNPLFKSFGVSDGGASLIFLPSDLLNIYSRLGHPIAMLGEMNNTVVTLTLCSFTFYIDCQNYSSRLLIVDGYPPLWVDASISPEEMTLHELLYVLRRPELLLVFPENSPVYDLLERDPEVIVGLVNSDIAGASVEHLLFIDYSSLRERLKSELGVYRFSALSTIIVYLALMASLSLYVYYVKWARFSEAYTRLLLSMGATHGAIVWQEAKSMATFVPMLSLLVLAFNYFNVLAAIDSQTLSLAFLALIPLLALVLLKRANLGRGRLRG